MTNAISLKKASKIQEYRVELIYLGTSPNLSHELASSLFQKQTGKSFKKYVHETIKHRV